MYVNELSSSNLFMKRNKYLELGGMDENLYTGEDTDLYNRIIAKEKSYYIRQMFMHIITIEHLKVF